VENNDALVWKSAVELRTMMQKGDVSSTEVVSAHLERIHAVNPALNAIVTLVSDHALEMAAAADDRKAAGEALGLLHGLPIAHKDLADTAGIRTTLGSTLMSDRVPTRNALVVERAIDAGAVTMGKTNTPEFGAGSQTFNDVFGPTLNPYDLTRTCGGSSGGAAVALASGMVPLADGSDMGGSLRNPASFCNVVGLRPSPGRVPAWPKAHPWSHLSTEGPMARTVDDVALLLAAQAGDDPRSPIALETPGGFFAPPIGEPTSKLRIAWAPDLGGLPIHADVTSALAHVPAVFEGLGHQVEPACPDLSEAGDVFDTLRAWSFALGHGDLIDEFGEKMKATVQWNVQRGRELLMQDHQNAWKVRAQLYQRTVDFFQDYDFLLAPVAQVPPFPIETEYITEINGVELQTYIEWMRVVSDVTIMNVPAISMPAGFTDDGLPIGLQIVAAPRADLALLEVAKQFETATNIAARRPPPLA
jgi:amidase